MYSQFADDMKSLSFGGKAPREELVTRKGSDGGDPSTYLGSDISEGWISEDDNDGLVDLSEEDGRARGQELLKMLQEGPIEQEAKSPHQLQQCDLNVMRPPTTKPCKLRAQLCSHAAPFVPQSIVGEDNNNGMIRRVVQEAFGTDLADFSTAETNQITSFHVTLLWPDERSCRSQAILVLLAAIQSIGPMIRNLCPSKDETWLSFEYLDVPSENLCWEFTSRGHCPRPGCHWVHAKPKFFDVTITLQSVPLAQMQQQEWFESQQDMWFEPSQVVNVIGFPQIDGSWESTWNNYVCYDQHYGQQMLQCGGSAGAMAVGVAPPETGCPMKQIEAKTKEVVTLSKAGPAEDVTALSLRRAAWADVEDDDEGFQGMDTDDEDLLGMMPCS